jgi:predicted AAA+ superfamily ATPase
VADLVVFRNLLRLAALRTAQVLNQSDLARDAKLPVATASRYLGLLETSFVLRRLPPHLGTSAARLIKSPKIFVTDSGLAAHLAGVDSLDTAADEPLRGPLLETYVLQNLAGILGAFRPKAELGFWSVQGRQEVDITVTDGRRVFAIEVKSASRFGDRDLVGLRSFAARTAGFQAGILAYNGVTAQSLGDGLFAVPIAMLLS